MDSAELDAPVALAAGFPAADRADWQALVAGVLARSGVPVPADRPPEAALASPSYDGFEIVPLYTAADRPAGWDGGVAGRSGTGWDVRARHADPDPRATNQAVLADLTNGVSSLWLVLGPAGLAVADLPTALAGVHLELAPIVLDAGDQAVPAAEVLLALAGSTELRGSLGADPLGWAADTGATVELAPLLRLAELAADRPGLLPITVDAVRYHQAGATDTEELAISLAAGVAYLRALTGAGHSLADAFDSMEFRYAVTADQFDSIAKLRAARLLWGRVGELSGLPASRQRQHAVTSPAMLSRRDPWVNILRGTLGCFAAAVGGAEAITVSPFDGALGLPDELGRRIARNTQAVLHDESSLARVSDPAGGSYYVETVTEQLAATAWRTFTELERDGGLPALLESGALATRLDRSWQRRRDAVAHRAAPLTGVSEFPLADEQPLTRRPAPAPPAGGLPRHRFAEPYEQLRDRSDRLLAEQGVRPRVFLAGLGPVAAHSARLAFARNLMLAGGVEPVVAAGEPDQLAKAFQASGARVCCLCASDRTYADQAEAAAGALREAGAGQVWLAGRPELATEKGLDNAIYQGCDALARLAEIHEWDGGSA